MTAGCLGAVCARALAFATGGVAESHAPILDRDAEVHPDGWALAVVGSSRWCVPGRYYRCWDGGGLAPTSVAKLAKSWWPGRCRWQPEMSFWAASLSPRLRECAFGAVQFGVVDEAVEMIFGFGVG